MTNRVLVKAKGEVWFKNNFLPKLKPLSILALLLTLALLSAFQGQNILDNPFIILLVAVPLTIQTYLVFFLAWYGGRWLKLPPGICFLAA